MVEPSVLVKVAGFPAFITGPSVEIRAVWESMSETRAAMPTATTAMAATRATATILRWVARSAVTSEWFMGVSRSRLFVAATRKKVQRVAGLISTIYAPAFPDPLGLDANGVMPPTRQQAPGSTVRIKT